MIDQYDLRYTKSLEPNLTLAYIMNVSFDVLKLFGSDLYKTDELYIKADKYLYELDTGVSVYDAQTHIDEFQEAA